MFFEIISQKEIDLAIQDACFELEWPDYKNFFKNYNKYFNDTYNQLIISYIKTMFSKLDSKILNNK